MLEHAWRILKTNVTIAKKSSQLVTFRKPIRNIFQQCKIFKLMLMTEKIFYLQSSKYFNIECTTIL